MIPTGSHKGASMARTLFTASMIGLGVIHAIFGEAVTRMFPTWPAGLPGRPFWAHLAGVLLVLLGLMVLANRSPRKAAASIGLLILVSVLCLHLPRSVRSGNFGDEWLNVFKWLTMSA